MQTILVTGGCGFIGSNFVRLAFERLPDARIINLDKLTSGAAGDDAVCQHFARRRSNPCWRAGVFRGIADSGTDAEVAQSARQS